MKNINKMNREEWEDVLIDWQLELLKKGLEPDPIRDEMVEKYGENRIKQFEESLVAGDSEEQVDKKWNKAMEDYR